MNGLSSAEALRWKTAITPIIDDYVKFWMKKDWMAGESSILQLKP